ncbi:feruloyl-CoA synthase [Lentisalinibacter sediminis]|uniref:feruloyl-CoA synthase n=1 Tax=Lentisalinibacter sediminis TaxID=2992237 RepID=UPI0038690664
MTDFRTAPFREVAFPSASMAVEERADGTLIVTPEIGLEPCVPNLLLELERQAGERPDQSYLMEREGGDGEWMAQTYRETRRDAHAVAQWLLDNGVGPDRSLLILSGNSIRHAVFKYGAMAVGVPVCPVSVNYALMGGDYGRLKHVLELVRPAVVFAEQTPLYKAALEAVDFGDAIVVTEEPELLERPAVAITEVLALRAGPEVKDAIEGLDPDAPAVYMLTSGSTSLPKAVVQTQRMLGANLAQAKQVLGETAGWKDVMLDWLPWNHVSGTSSKFGVMIAGGTLYIDGGRPLPGQFDLTIRNLKEVPVSFFTNVPAGYAMLADALERDDELRETFFSKLRLALYGGAGLPQALYDRLQELAVRTTGKRVFFTTGYGATETTSGCMAIYFDTEEVGIGLPMPGLTIELVPRDERYEVRMKGPMITPGYLHMPEKNAEIFDDEGYFLIGDAAQFNEPGDIERGLRFAGRLAEEFKLANGTWVSAGNLRAAVVQACSPLVSDLLVCGLNRDYVAVLAWPNRAGVEQVLGAAPPASARELAGEPAVRERIVQALAARNRANPGSSTRIRRFAFLDEPPSIDGHELSDKGTVNQSVALRRRAADVERLYAASPGEDVIVLE